jgi:excisionase family DNA binding protein
MNGTHAPRIYSRDLSAPLLTQAEVAEILKVSRWTLLRLISRGDLPVIRVGERRRFLMSDVDAYIERNREALP